MGEFITTYKFRGVNGKHDYTTMKIHSGDFGGQSIADDAGAYEGAVTQITNALSAVSLCNLETVKANYLVSADADAPADVLANTGRVLALKVHLQPKNGQVRTKVINIPAPDPSVFIADGVTMDVTNASIVDLVQQFGQHAEWSDGEMIDLTAGAYGNGIHSGELKSVPREFVR